MIGMHGGLPPSNTFPFTSFHAGLLQLAAGDPAATAAAPAQDKGDAHATVMKIDDPLLVATAQQYNMHAHVGPNPCSLVKPLPPCRLACLYW